jgi:hypothetical protein
VTAGSVTVHNTARTQTFTEGIDYTLTVVGLETRIQRQVAGSILDGQDVLIDYAYDAGGTFAYTQTDQNWNVGWAYANLLNVYFRHLDSSPKLTSGAPTFSLNTVSSNVYGARADVPLNFWRGFVVGGGVEREDRHETIAPYRRQSDEIYAQTEEPFFGSGMVRVASRRARQDYENSQQNVNLQAYDLRYVARTRFGLDLSADLNYELDTGTLNPRRRTSGALKARWAYRKLTMTMDVARTHESQAAADRTRQLVQILARRDF